MGSYPTLPFSLNDSQTSHHCTPSLSTVMCEYCAVPTVVVVEPLMLMLPPLIVQTTAPAPM